MLTYSNGYWEVYRRFQEDFLVGGGVGYAGGTPHRVICHGGKKISMKGAQDLLALFKKKNIEKINMKKFFSAGSKEQH